MHLKSTLLALALLASSTGFAAEYFIKTAAAGTGDGSSWDNAMAFETWYTALNTGTGYADGDCFYFAGGTYTIPSVTASTAKNVAKGFKLIGGYDPALTGTEKTVPTDFTTHRTIFSGDRNADGEPNAGDARCILAFQVNTTHHAGTRPLLIQGIDFCYAYSEEPTNENTSIKGALYVNNSGDVVIKNCRFYQNVLTKGGSAQGGSALLNYRSTIHAVDCEFTENKGVARGAAIRMTSDNNAKGYLTLERCLVAGNEVSEGTGSAICVQNAKELNLVNTTITGNKAASNSAVFVNGATDGFPYMTVNIIGSTIAANACGAELQFNTGAPKLNIINSIIAPANGKTAIITGVASDNERYNIVSGGHNVIGTFKNTVTTDATFPALESDSQSEANQATAVFSSTELQGGVLTPATSVKAGAAPADVQTAVTDWSLGETTVNVAVDQLGTARTDKTTPGAYAKEVSDTDAIGTLKAVTTGDAATYTLSGVRVSGALSKGVYVRNGKKFVVR